MQTEMLEAAIVSNITLGGFTVKRLASECGTVAWRKRIYSSKRHDKTLWFIQGRRGDELTWGGNCIQLVSLSKVSTTCTIKCSSSKISMATIEVVKN